jgi:hypothetical protein
MIAIRCVEFGIGPDGITSPSDEIPAKAGGSSIHKSKLAFCPTTYAAEYWIPAFAGISRKPRLSKLIPL